MTTILSQSLILSSQHTVVLSELTVLYSDFIELLIELSVLEFEGDVEFGHG